jgi:hypothetical protein
VDGNLSFRQRRPRQAHQLPLECIATEQQKENQENDRRCLGQRSEGAHRARPEEVTELERGLVHDDVSGRLTRSCGATGRLGRRFFHLGGCVLHFLYIADLADSHARKPGSELGRRFGQLFDDRLHFSAQRIRAENERADHACHDDDSAGNARDLDRFEPCDERIQRVGNNDAEQQRHHEVLRPRQDDDRRQHRQNS